MPMRRMYLFLVIAYITATCATVYFFTQDDFKKQEVELHRHCRVIAGDVWDFDTKGPVEYLTLAARFNNYTHLTVYNEKNETFLEIHGVKPSWLEQSLIRVGILRPARLASNILYKSQLIGAIEVEHHPRTIYTFTYVFIVSSLFFLVLMFIVRILIVNRALDASRLNLEIHVSERTADLKNEIVERKRAEKERVEMEDQLRQSQKMEVIGQLAGGVAHDFNNLLTVIIGNSELLLSKVTKKATSISEEMVRPRLEEIWVAGKQAAALTRQLLAFSRREVTQPEVLDPRKVVTSIEEMLRRLIGEHIQLDVHLVPGSGHIHADSGQLKQILMNLAINSADAMPNGGQLQIRVEDITLDEGHKAAHINAKPGRYVMLSVADNGIGMTADTLQHLFEPFFTTKPVGKGTGLGLASVYGAVGQMGGHIHVDSSCGVGSTFNVYVPVIDIKEVKLELELESEGDPAPVCDGETILVCEDEGMVRDVICLTLRAAGYKVLDADCGEAAIKLITDYDGGAVDMLISDVVMPGMNGRELAESLAPKHPDMCVLFVSGYTANHLDAHGLQGGAIELLQKPFGPATLLRRVRQVINSKRVIR